MRVWDVLTLWAEYFNHVKELGLESCNLFYNEIHDSEIKLYIQRQSQVRELIWEEQCC